MHPATGCDLFNQMVEHNASLNQTFAALADPTRRAILARLRQGSCTVGALAEPFSMSLAAVSKHLRALERAGLVAREVEGREHHLSLNAEPLRAAAEWTADYREFWDERLDALEAMLESHSEWRKR